MGRILVFALCDHTTADGNNIHISVPISAPLMIIMIALCEAFARQSNNN